jgi:hypothetical protein
MNVTAQAIAARNHRLGKDCRKQQPAPVKRPMLTWVRPDQNEHVKAWEAHKVTCDDYALVGDYLKAVCFQHGMPMDELYRKRGGRERVEARYRIIRLVAARYPKMSSLRLGKLFQCDHTVILYCLRRLGLGNKPRKALLTVEQVRDIRARAATGREMLKDLADIYRVSRSHISAIVSGRRLRGMV